MNYRGIIHLQHDTLQNLNKVITKELQDYLHVVEMMWDLQASKKQMAEAACSFVMHVADKINEVVKEHNALVDTIKQPEQSVFDKLADEIIAMLKSR